MFEIRKPAIPLIALGLSWIAGPAAARALDPGHVGEFIREMSSEHGFDRGELEGLFRQAALSNAVLEAISRPAEAKPWHQYRPIFLTQARIDGGVRFWSANEATLQRASERFGVPPEVMVAIIGVETNYGSNTGRFRVLDALATLAFNYPPRARFFRSELQQFLILTREEGMDPTALTGSYAGAMGLPQFISSSFRHYAVDFDGDGVKDIWTNPADAIGSVGNYLHVHGWQRDARVAVRARVRGEGYRTLLEQGLEPHTPVTGFRSAGVEPEIELSGDPRAALIALEQADGQEYWLGLRNFYVITRYNRSPLYAMAVYQLSKAIRDAYGRAARG